MTARDNLKSQFVSAKRFIAFVYPMARKQGVLVLSVLLIAGLTEGMSILMLLPVLAALTPGSTELSVTLPSRLNDLFSQETLTLQLGSLLIVLVALVSAQALFARFSTIVMVKALVRITDHVRMTLFTSIVTARYDKIVRANHADITHAVTTDVDRIQIVLNNSFLLIQSAIMLAIYIAISAFVSIEMTAIASAMGILLFGMLHPIRQYASVYGERMTTHKQTQFRTVTEFLAGLKLVKSLNAEPRYIRSYGIIVSTISGEIVNYFRISAIPAFIIQISTTVCGAIFIYIAFTRLNMTLEKIAILLFILMRIAPRFNMIQTHMQQILLNVGSFNSIRGFIDRFQVGEGEALQRSGTLDMRQGLAFEAVDFRYGDTHEPLTLNAVTFNLRAGAVTAIVGPSGAGKSTIADLLLGLLEPSGGRILIDGVVLDQANRRDWRDGLAYVPQDVFLTHDTIAGNLRLAVPGADEAVLWRALDRACASNFVRSLPETLYTVVGDRGVRLSGGERQRIALARALLLRPKLLILDEATSALDWENQNLIASAIRELRGSMTVVTIAHRPSMIAFADDVVVIDHGMVVESGSYSALLASSNSYLSRLMAGEQAQIQPIR